MSKVVLVDMDGVVADFERGFAAIWRSKYPNRIFIREEDRRNFYLADDYPEEYRADILEIIYNPGFAASLPLVRGAKEALEAMIGYGFTVKVCTSPLDATHNWSDKCAWVERFLGAGWWKNLIITRDKSLVRGDILIDDHPNAASRGGSMVPTWQHIVFDRAYNRRLVMHRRIANDWRNWREIVLPCLYEKEVED